MSVPSSPAEAREIIEEIAERNGWISQRDREQTPKSVLKAIANLQEKLGAAARRLAKDLYKSNARFLFELVQNAEDNNYFRAKATGSEPYIKFTIRPDTIIVESNEDGFTIENVRAICSIDDSTKTRTSAQYYIGEKGIGFKSVFMVASKVHIHSPPWSFSFNHKQGESGMGMVTPEWESIDAVLNQPLTRITLTLLDSLDLDDLLSQFDDLPDTMLLFLNKLGKIIIDEDVQENFELYDEADEWNEDSQKDKQEDKQYHEGKESQDDADNSSIDDDEESEDDFSLDNDVEDESDDEEDESDDEENESVQQRAPKMRVKCITTYSCEYDQRIGKAKVTVSKDRIKKPVSYSKTYRIARHSLSNLPIDEHRDYKTAEVILAFPVHNFGAEPDRPLITRQQVYAYMPIRDFGFPFIINSDFVAQASREDVIENARNTSILEGAAETFVEAVIQFCQQPVLQYMWMNYIPEDGQVSSPFWSQLLIRIRERIKKTPILWPRTRSSLRRISQLRILPEKFQDIHGEPLVADFPDQALEMYLDPKYGTYNVKKKLKSLGLKVMSTRDFIQRIKRDANSSSSRMKSADEDWHERVASALLRVFEKQNMETRIQTIKNIPLIPLEDHCWVSITDADVYFSDTHHTPVPSDLGLSLVDPSAASNAKRRQLFIELGVVDASKKRIQRLILKKHKNSWDKVTLESSVKHLNYLYWTENPPGDTNIRQSAPFCLFNDQSVAVNGDHDLYFQTNKRYGIQELFTLINNKDRGSDAFGSFINNQYFDSAPPKKPGGRSPSFETWLEKWVGILRSPRFRDSKDPYKLSKIFSYIVEKHPELLLGILKTHWSKYESELNDKLTKKLSGVVIPCTNVGGEKLRETFLPLPELVAHCKEFLNPQIFPFLTLDDGSSIKDWKFLEIFGVGVETNLDFYLEILRRFKDNVQGFSYKIYEEIQKKLSISKIPEGLIKRVRDAVHDDDLIYIPTSHKDGHWTWEDECVWDGPAYLSVKRALLPALSAVNNSTLTAFFVKTLEISDVNCYNLLDELASIKEISDTVCCSAQEIENINDIYTRLRTMSSSLSRNQLRDIRTRFEKDCFIYDGVRQAWIPPSSCLWSKDATIPGKFTILNQYRQLKDFFVDILNVKIPDLGMLVDELSQAASSKPTVTDIKSLFWQINNFSPTRNAVEKLNDLPIFPVKSETTKLNVTVLRTRFARFSINDRQPWAKAFGGKLDFLDFNLEEVRRLQPLLSALNVEDRYLSRAVVETSSFQDKGEWSKKRTRQMRSRAHALARCASHFSSPRVCTDSLFIYHLFLQAEVYETDSMLRNLVYTQHNDTVTVEINRSKLHISEKLGTLKIYVPKDRKGQELCFLQMLPTKLFNEVIMGKKISNSSVASDSEAVRIIAALLTSSDDVVCDLLDDAGIVPVPYPDDFDIEAHDQVSTPIKPTVQDEGRSLIHRESRPFSPPGEIRRQGSEESIFSQGSRLLSPTPPPSYKSSYLAATPTHRRPSLSSISSQPSTPRSSEPAPFSANSGQTEYLRLLNNVISAAKRKRGRFPSRGAFNLGDLFDALPNDSDAEPITYNLPFGVRSENQLAHDMRVGAAGELYVFEILSRLETRLHKFGRDNWQSTIRRYVTVHEDYSDMEPWKGAETSDITYNDKKGEFTKLLVENGFLKDFWIGAKPKYYLEVKTTTKECGTRFFISKSQYQRMERMRLKKREVSSEVYIILRVFNLDKDTIDMRLYVDPKGVKEGGDLIFTPESYSVLPAGSSNA
ncbi:hypothetical protein N431DRAFT_493510 [Stipitochalara longipes BDJ]|nr:hypothetical protein N431DRAFT_493510 [Stipitochalara longipes BDJ]